MHSFKMRMEACRWKGGGRPKREEYTWQIIILSMYIALSVFKALNTDYHSNKHIWQVSNIASILGWKMKRTADLSRIVKFVA